MGRASTTVAAATASLVLLGGVTYAAVQSVDTSPDAQVVIPSSPTATPHPATSSHSGRPARPVSSSTPDARGSDDPAGHDAGDDHGGDADRQRGDKNKDKGDKDSGRDREREPGDHDRHGGRDQEGKGDKDKGDEGGGSTSGGGSGSGSGSGGGSSDGGGGNH